MVDLGLSPAREVSMVIAVTCPAASVRSDQGQAASLGHLGFLSCLPVLAGWESEHLLVRSPGFSAGSCLGAVVLVHESGFSLQQPASHPALEAA